MDAITQILIRQTQGKMECQQGLEPFPLSHRLASNHLQLSNPSTSSTTAASAWGSGDQVAATSHHRILYNAFDIYTMAEVKLENTSSWKQFGGWNRRYKYKSQTLGNTETVFTVYFPPQAEKGPVPVVYYLSGLTCTDENFVQKAGAQRMAAQLGIALVAPDTSPRGLNVPGESDGWDFGVGAGFYLNATQDKWAAWQMYDFIVKELPSVLSSQLGKQLDTSRAAIMGHSMGGHGALTIALKNPDRYKSVSAFSPICNPVNVPWGVKAFAGYLGEDRATWSQYDATELLKSYSGPHLPMLVDQGTADSFLATQLAPEALEAAAKEKGYNMTLRMQEGYDHSYFFISTFIEDHLLHHAKALGVVS